MKKNTTPEDVITLKENEIFVFGSNESGIHGAGAAHLAKQWGAKSGVGFGLEGQTFAIPTKDFHIRTLPIEKIKKYVDVFFDVALQKGDLKFLVTEIGCGRAGYEPRHIAPLFKECAKLPNIWLPERFWEVLKSMPHKVVQEHEE